MSPMNPMDEASPKRRRSERDVKAPGALMKGSGSQNSDVEGEDVTPSNNGGPQIWVPNADRSRVFLYQIATFLMRTDIIRRLNSGGDLDLASVLITVWIRTVEGGMRDPNYRDQFSTLDRTLDYSSAPTINATSIAGATGLARETVRRKLKTLEKEGSVVKERNAGYRLGDNSINKAALLEAFQQIMKESSRFLNACIVTKAIEPKSNAAPTKGI